MSQAIAAALSKLQASTTASGVIAGNIANSDSDGYKRFYTLYADVVSSEGNYSQGVSTRAMRTVDIAGPTKRTGIVTDIAIDGAGLFPVTDIQEGSKKLSASSSVLFSRNGSFRRNKDGDFEDGFGHKLLAWNLDANGNLPPNKSITQSLSVVNIQRLVTSASATTTVDVSLNLDSSIPSVGNGQASLYFSNVGLKPSPYNAFIDSKQIIYPNANNSLHIGEGIIVKTINPQQDNTAQTYNFIYGGLVETLKFSNAGNDIIAGTGSNLATDDFTISVNGNLLPAFKRGAGTTNLEVLQNIVDQINATIGAFALSARLVNDGTNSSIFIAPHDANQAMTFGGVTPFRDSIGLNDSNGTQVSTNRFASLDNLANLLNKISGVTANTSTSGNASMSLSSALPMYIGNFTPLGHSSDFLSEFNIQEGFLASAYNPYDPNNNMASGAIRPHYSRDLTVYDSMGNSYNFLISFLKTGANTWSTEIYSYDKTVVNIAGRTDGLLQAGVLKFNGDATLQAMLPTIQAAISNDMPPPDRKLGATNGQQFTIAAGTSTYTFNYHDGLINGAALNGAATTLSAGAGTDTLQITCGTSNYTFTRAQIAAAGDNQTFLRNLAAQINDSVGGNAIEATVIDAGGGNFKLQVNAVDITMGIFFSGTGSLGTELGLTTAQDLATDTSRFSTLYDMQKRVNETTGLYPLKASILQGSSPGLYKISIKPQNSGVYMTFGGTVGTINSPLGNGATDTIANAMGLTSTNGQKQLTSLTEIMQVNWASYIGAQPNNIAFNFGQIGVIENSITQNAGSFQVLQLSQNGVSSGELKSIKINSRGVITAIFSNSKTRDLYQIPVADFANPNGLLPISGTISAASKDSGALNLKIASTEGAGVIISGTIEESNVEIAQELAELMKVQRSYQANAKVINVWDKMFEEFIHRTFA